MSYVDPASAGTPKPGGTIKSAWGADVQTDIEIIVRDEKLDAVAAGYLTQGSSADQHTGLQSFLTAIGNAVGGRGGSGFIPAGVYHMGSGTVTYPAGVTCGVEGATPPPSYGTATTGIGGTVLKWDTDVAAAPHTVFGVTLGGAGGMPQALSRITLEGPTQFSAVNGKLPAALGGVNAWENNQLQDLNIVSFSSGVGWGGSNNSYDHSTPKNLRVGTCGYAFNFLTNSSGSGDFNAYACNLSGTLAAIGVASGASSGLAGSSWFGCALYGPIGIHRYNDNSGLQADFIDTCTFLNVSFETSGVAAIFDDLWSSGTLYGKILNSFFSNGLAFAAPNSGYAQWSGTFNVSSSSGTSITVTDGTGFMFWPGQTVTGSGIPANTTISSVAGTWPWSSATLTLNNTVTSPTSVTIAMPLFATWVCSFITGNEILGGLGGNPANYPYFAVGGGTGSFANNRIKDWSGTLTRATAGPLLVKANSSSPVRTWGNTFGTDGDVSCPLIGTASRSGTIAAGDVLMTVSGQFGAATRCDATRKPIGLAIKANSSGNVDYYVRGSATTNGVTLTVNNYTASSIAAGALVKADAANPGGVTTASSPNDGWVIGVNGTSIINAGGSGTLAELWL